MWLYICFSIVFANIISTNLVKHDQRPFNDKETGALFAGVIKNISRVNNALQELISNYEHMQKIYKSQEKLSSAFSDAESDGRYENKKNKRSKSKSVTTRIQPGGYQATQMIWSGEKTQESENSEEQVSNDDAAKEELQMKPHDDKSFESSKIDSEQRFNINKKERNEKAAGPEIANQAHGKLKGAEIIFVEPHKKTPRKETRNVELDLLNTDHKAPKTRYVKVSFSELDANNENVHNKKSTDNSKKEENSENEPESDPAKNNYELFEKVKKTLYSELFSPKKFQGELMSKSVQAEKNQAKSYDKIRKDNGGSKILRSRSDNSKTALVVDTSKNQAKNTKNESNVTSETDEEVDKEEFEATVLREAYGDACMKLVLRKCYKACKAVSKSVCMKYKCKDSYKEKFYQFAKKGCIKEFEGHDTRINTSNPDKSDKVWDIDELSSSRRNQKFGSGDVNDTDVVDVGEDYKKKDKKKTHEESDDMDDNNNENEEKDSVKKHQNRVSDRTQKNGIERASGTGFPDMTGRGYLKTCLPHLQAEMRRSGGTMQDSRNETTTDHKTFEIGYPNINILRHKYERACKKVSYNKCRNACKYAYTKTCESFTCKKLRLKTYKKTCKNKCKAAYSLSYDSSSTDSDSDDTDSDDSDSDDSDSHDSDSDDSDSSD